MSHHQFVTRSDLVEIRDAGVMGRGVFAVSRVPAGTLLFSDPVMLVPEDLCPPGSFLDAIVFRWSAVVGGTPGLCAIALGVGTVLNHSDSPNVVASFGRDPDRVDFHALRDIEAGEQLTHDYDYDEYPPGWQI
jgi:SET domain-containing protein